MYIGTSISAGDGQLNVRIMSGMGYLPIFHRLSDGKYFVASEPGRRFSIHLHNTSTDYRQLEVAAAVDGKDIITGEKAVKSAPGLVLEPGYEATLEAWGASEKWFEFQGFPATTDLASYRSGSIALAVYRESRKGTVVERGSSPDMADDLVQRIRADAEHTAYAQPISSGLQSGLQSPLRERQFSRSLTNPTVVNIGYAGKQTLRRLGLLQHAEPPGFVS